MSNYDGPSYFKKHNPKIKPLKEVRKTNRSEQKKTFKTDYESSIPDRIQKRSFESKSTPPAKNTKRNRQNYPSQPFKNPAEEKKSGRFRSKYIPASLQQLDGWKSNERNKKLLIELEKRLAKETDSYLLFANYLAPNVEAALKSVEKEAAARKTKVPPVSKSSEKMDVLGGNEKAVYKQTKEKVERVQEELAHNLLKQNTGLHRSLSKIIAEDQKVLANSKNHLDSLFSKKD